MAATLNSGMSFDLTVTQARNQLLTPVGRYRALYQQGLRAADVVKLDLAPGNIYNSNPSDTINQLVVSTSGLLQLTLVQPNVVLPVNSLFILDSGCTTYSIKNPSLTDTIQVQLCALSTLVVTVIGSYWGNASDPGAAGYGATFVQGLANQSLQAKGTLNFNAPLPTDYLWYASPQQATFTSGGFSGGFSQVATVTIGVTPYFLYRSDYPGLGQTIVTIS